MECMSRVKLICFLKGGYLHNYVGIEDGIKALFYGDIIFMAESVPYSV